MRGWKNRNGYAVLQLHYTADPQDKGPVARKEGLPLKQYLRENELDFSIKAGKPVFGEYWNEQLHADPELRFNPEHPLWFNWDFGYHHPAVVAGQAFSNRAVWVVAELLGEDTSLEDFINYDFFPWIRDEFDLKPSDMARKNILHSCDPGGKQVSDKSNFTSLDFLAQSGIFPMYRRSAITEGLGLIWRSMAHSRTDAAGGFKINPNKAPILTEALRGGCVYPPAAPGKPESNAYAKDGYYEHVVDPTRYFFIHATTMDDPPEREKPKDPGKGDRIRQQILERSKYRQ